VTGDQPVTGATTHTVEEVVRKQLSDALGGVRGMLEAAVPTIAFTVVFLTQHNLRLAIYVSLACAGVLLVVRLVQRSTAQFVLNAIFGIGIGWVFVRIAASRGGDADDQALAYFLPGILYNAGYAGIFVLTCLIGWPLVGFMVGSVTGDPTAWHQDRQVVRLCTKLTLLLALPCILRVVVQAPIWLAAHADTISTGTAVGVLGVLKIAMGWPLQLACLAGMVWLLGRNHTPVSYAGEEPSNA
jgi:uncharacterized protein DUF3159